MVVFGPTISCLWVDQLSIMFNYVQSEMTTPCRIDVTSVNEELGVTYRFSYAFIYKSFEDAMENQLV